jgi:homoserine kinase type II
MAVYTHLSAEDLAALIAQYDVGELVSAKGIAEGVSNSNWMVETTGQDGNGARFILTMYERRIELAELPFFLDLLDHLSSHGLPVPHTIHDRHGASWRMFDEDKAVALIEYLPGVSVDRPTPRQAYAVGASQAELHIAAQAFGKTREDRLNVLSNLSALENCSDELLRIDPRLADMIARGQRVHRDWPASLPETIIHSDLFPDNVLMLGDTVTGLIDFYFACHGAMAYDLAVTHAAWCFERDGSTFHPEIGSALLSGYQSVRPLEPREVMAMPILAQAACLRFVASRTQDWIETPPDAHVMRKDPMDFVRRWDVYAEMGDRLFA